MGINFCFQLILYSIIFYDSNCECLLQVSVSTSMNLLSESQTEKYKDLRALLQLLTNLSSKDLVSMMFPPCDCQPVLSKQSVQWGDLDLTFIGGFAD